MTRTIDELKRDLKESREVRAKIIEKYGFIPESIWDVKYNLNKRLDQFVESQNDKSKDYHANRIYSNDKKLLKAISISNKSVCGKDGGLSIFPYQLGQTIIKFYANKGDTIFDPFMGHNSRMQICFENGCNYIGYDVSHFFMEENIKLKEMILKRCLDTKTPVPNIEIFEKSSTKIHLNNNSIDLIFTSPPYWDLEYYGDEPEQLGQGHSYPSFLEGMRTVLNECARILKPEKYCVINCNDFRKGGKFYSYHSDIINLANKPTFKLWDVIIVDWGRSIGSCFASQIDERKITAKRHEYLLVFRKGYNEN